MQSFHAVTYAVVVQAGVVAFINTQNWFFLVLCTTFLFHGERILRKIFNLGSSFGTLKDLGETGIAAFGAARAITRNFRGRKREENKNSQSGGSDDSNDSDSSESGDSEGGSTQTQSGSRGIMQTPGAIRNRSMNPQLSGIAAAQQLVNQKAEAKRTSLGRRLVSGSVGVVTGAGGALLAGTASLATGKDLKEVAVTAGVGYAIGKGIGKGTVGSAINGVANIYAGAKMKKAIMNGEMDDEFKKAGLDLDAIASDDAHTANLIRQALADQESAAVRRGEKVGTAKFYKTMTKNK